MSAFSDPFSLMAMNCLPARFSESIKKSLIDDFPDGLNCNKEFDAIIVSPDTIDKDTLKEMRRLQPKAKVSHKTWFRADDRSSSWCGTSIWPMRCENWTLVFVSLVQNDIRV